MTRYAPSRNYLTAGFIALGVSVLLAWCASRWTPWIVPSVLFFFSAAILLFLALRPVIEIHPNHLRVGQRVVPWTEVRSVDLTGWTSPLIVKLTLEGNRRLALVYPAELESAMSLLRQLRRMAKSALIDGIPHQEFWGQEETAVQTVEKTAVKELPSPRYPLLRQEDEAEVERLFQRLKTVGHLDSKSGSDEN